jgi:alkylated DNA repair dioxygenase AlkB
VSAPSGFLYDVEPPADLPSGFRYQPEFLSGEEEATLLAAIGQVAFADFEMHGVIARRRVAFFGRRYDDAGQASISPIPAFLLPLRERLAAWAGIEAEDFVMALINAYPPGAPIGWHRDAPQYELIAGVSLLSACTMKLRPYVYVPPGARASTPGKRRVATHTLTLDPRSAYVMMGEARSAYEHHIPPVATQRYSITFRTARPGR